MYGLLLAHLVLGARNSDGDDTGWSQLLVFVLLGVFWAISGLMKARSQKNARRKQQRELEKQPQARGGYRPAQHPVQLFRQKSVTKERAPARPRPAAQRPKPVSPRPVVAPAAAPAGSAASAQRYRRPQKPTVVQGPAAKAQKKPAVLKPLMAEAAESLRQLERPEVMPPEIGPREPVAAQVEPPEEAFAALEHVHGLQKAILSYEIFGRAVALREPSEHSWMR